MASLAVRKELVQYGIKIANAGLVAGAGGNISAREGGIVWMKPSGVAMDDMAPADLCGMELETGKQVSGARKPTSEVNMHLAIYHERPDVTCVFHTHSPWASGVISSGARLRPMFAEFVCDLGRVGTVPYITPTTQMLADAMAAKAAKCDTIFMVNHGIAALGVTMKQAYYRCVVVEDAAKSMVAAAVVGKPRFLSSKQVNDLMALEGPKHRIKMMEGVR
ncbi:MAG: class II aldolase/adducin family protein [Lentisphaerae bacterium]|nr:class II aldolase/adducin family protein [Lentisphaerota bacterium]